MTGFSIALVVLGVEFAALIGAVSSALVAQAFGKRRVSEWLSTAGQVLIGVLGMTIATAICLIIITEVTA